MTLDVTERIESSTVAEPRGLAAFWLGGLRILLGVVLLWAGLDKVIGLGYPTKSGQAVIDGASATEGYLAYGIAEGAPAHGILTPLAGNPLIDALYLAATIGAGAAILLGVAVKPAAFGAAALFLGLWFSAWPLEFNPVIDQHLVYAVLGLALASLHAGRYFGLGRWWENTSLVQNRAWLA